MISYNIILNEHWIHCVNMFKIDVTTFQSLVLN
jgi:hypothetical protein